MEQGRLLLLEAYRDGDVEWFWLMVSHRDPFLLSRGVLGVEVVQGDPLALPQRLFEDEGARLWESNIFFPAFRPVLTALWEYSKRPETVVAL